MHPPHQPQPNDFGRKITPNLGEVLFFFFSFFGDHLILGEKAPSILVKTFFFGEHMILGEKNV